MKKKLLFILSAVALVSNAYAQSESTGLSCNNLKLQVLKANQEESFIPDENEEGLNYFYHETFENIGGTMDAPLNFDFGTAAFGYIPEDMLIDKNHPVGLRNTCKRAGDAVLITGSGAYLNIELGEMRGRKQEFELYFKIKSEKNEESVFSILNTNTGIVIESYYNAQAPTEWTWYKVSFEQGNPFTQLEFDNEIADNGIYLDEVLVVVKDTFLNGPIAMPASNVDDEEFTANWIYSYDAKGVYLDVFSYADELSTREVLSETQNFESVNVAADGKLNTEDPKMPEGWTYRFTKTLDKVFPKTDKGYGIVLNKEIEYLSTPNYDEAPYSTFKFDLKAEEGAKGTLIVEEKIPRLYSKKDLWVNNPYEWSKIGEFNLSNYTSENKTIDLTSQLSGKGIYVRYRVVGTEDKGAEISNVSYTYGGDIVREKIMEIENLELTGTQFIVSDIDSKKEYFYRLRTFDDNYVSDYSPVVRGRGRVPSDEMVAPEVLEPENVSVDRFTAKWMPSVFTNAYRCEVYREYKATEDKEDFLFYSEDFNSITNGTITDPVYGEISQDYTVTYYNVLPGFLIDHGLTANGMLGIYNVYKEGRGWAFGHLNSPVYNFPENRDYTIKITAHAEVGTQFKISSYNDPGRDIQTSRVGTFKTPTQDFEFKFPASNYTFFEIDLTEGYLTLLFDKMEIYLDVEKGDEFSGIVDESHTMTATNTFETPYWTKDVENDKIYYQVKSEFIQPNSSTSLDIYVSEPSKKMYVDYSGLVGIEDAVTTEANVYVANGELNVVVPESQKVTVYDMTGAPVAIYEAQAGHNVYNLNGYGVYIVVVGNKCVKVVK